MYFHTAAAADCAQRGYWAKLHFCGESHKSTPRANTAARQRKMSTASHKLARRSKTLHRFSTPLLRFFAILLPLKQHSLNCKKKTVDFSEKHGRFSRKVHCFSSLLAHFLLPIHFHRRERGANVSSLGVARALPVARPPRSRHFSATARVVGIPYALVFAKSRWFLDTQRRKQPTKMQKAADVVGGRAQKL